MRHRPKLWGVGRPRTSYYLPGALAWPSAARDTTERPTTHRPTNYSRPATHPAPAPVVSSKANTLTPTLTLTLTLAKTHPAPAPVISWKAETCSMNPLGDSIPAAHGYSGSADAVWDRASTPQDYQPQASPAQALCARPAAVLPTTAPLANTHGQGKH